MTLSLHNSSEMSHKLTSSLPGTSNRSSIFLTSSNDKRNLLWKAFRKTVLEPHDIDILENAETDKVPDVLLELVEDMCRNLDRHEKQATNFREAVNQGRGFGPSPIFPPDVVPPFNGKVGLSRCMEPAFDKATLPIQESSPRTPLFELPTPRPGLACGFSSKAFSEKELRSLPEWISVVGTYSDYSTGSIQPGMAVHVPFLMFERTYGHARHEIETAMNYCAMNGAAALRGLAMLYDKACDSSEWERPSNPVVFSCTVDNDVGIIHHHWIDDRTFMAAPLCKFDLRDNEHFMHFLAWTEAIEQWAVYFLLPNIKEALSIITGSRESKAVPTSVTIEEKNEKLKQSMKLAFENISWRNERIPGAPLAVTATMRVRSPQPEEVIVIDDPISATDSTRSHASGMSDTYMTENTSAQSSSLHTSPDDYLAPSPTLSYRPKDPTASYQSNSQPSPSIAGSTLERKRTHTDMPPPARPEGILRSNTPAMPSPAFSTSAVSEASTRAGSMAPSKSSVMPSPTLSTGSSTDTISKASQYAFSVKNQPTPTVYFHPSHIHGTTHARTVSSQTNATSVRISPPMSHAIPAPLSLSSAHVSSKRSLSSLRQQKRIRSPSTPEILGSGPSPRSTAGFRSIISNSLGMIKEHTKPKRARTDNSGPNTPKADAPPLPTPAYDKREFHSLDTNASPRQNTAWVDHILSDRVVVTDDAGPLRNGNPASGAVSPPLRGDALSPPSRTNVVSPPSRNDIISPPPRTKTPNRAMVDLPRNDTVSPPPRNRTPLYAAAEVPPRNDPVSPPPRNKTPLYAAAEPPPRSNAVSPPPRNKTPLYAAAEPPPRHDAVSPPLGSNAASPPVGNKTPSHAATLSRTEPDPILYKSAATTRIQPVKESQKGSSNYLPLRDYPDVPPVPMDARGFEVRSVQMTSLFG